MDDSQSTGPGLLLAGRYRLGESIGSGGMGRVWRAHDEVLHRVVAIKELTAGMYANDADRTVLQARTRKEARAAARISHPGVVTVHDVLDHDARPWIVMQYVDGDSLADATRDAGRISVGRAAHIGLRVLRALDAAHAAGVLHRDVKPANVLLGRDGRTLITDFGIAAIEGDSTITRTGEIVGSIDYLAPERVRGADPGPASDLWSLGATLYTAVEGVSPFRRSSPLSTMRAVVDDEPRPPEHAGPLTPVIMALLRKEPEERPSTAEAERMLREVEESWTPAPVGVDHVPTAPLVQNRTYPPADTRPTLPPDAGRAGRLRKTAIALAVTAVVILGSGYAAYTQLGDDGKSGDAASGPPSAAPSPGADSGAGADGTKPGATPERAGQRSAAPSDGTDSQAGAGGDSRAEPGGGERGVPEGWRRVQDPAGFSLVVPKGWYRMAAGGQIDYTPDGGRHRIRIGIDPAPDFDDPYDHLLDLEQELGKLPDYTRVTLTPNVYRDQEKSALWEFTWTERQTFPGPRRAIDQMYFGDDGTEYALYMSAPAESWATTREQFDTMLRGWRPPR
ncbi:protein kinase [Streptomyces sp. NPDC014894]|uniref:serine/threonine-protein kinase n=1 Tax=Streptomyces sp. NPDC014894 TaxID=3364931 RepID=UPI0036F5902B